MPDREKVITALAICTGKCKCFGCWYGQNNPDFRCQDRLKEDAIAMLREQEPVTMKPYYFNYVCSGCGSEIDGEFIDYTGWKIKFCPNCGRKGKWNDCC